MYSINIYLHIGTEKTGSSFIQSVFSRHSKELRKSKIFYPGDLKWNREMNAGRISPGNGEQLLLLLKSNEWDKVKSWLNSQIEMAKVHNCNTLLLSNENLLEPLSIFQTFEKFNEICINLGAGLPNMLLLLRNPVDQAFSLYKHRAKTGDIEDIEHWLMSKYHLPIHLEGFINNLELIELNCLVKKYERNSKYLVRLFFEDWLKVTPPQKWIDSAVNPSLTISELTFLKRLRESRSELVHSYYEYMIKIPIHQKSDDKHLKQNMLGVIENSLNRFSLVWEKCNRLLSSSDVLVIPQKTKSSSIQDSILSFSDTQIEAWISYMIISQTTSFRFKLLVNKYKPMLGKIKWKLINMLNLHGRF